MDSADFAKGGKTFEKEMTLFSKIECVSSLPEFFSHRVGVDYKDSFSTSATQNTIRKPLNIAAYFEFRPRQLEIESAFLNPNLKIHGKLFMADKRAMNGISFTVNLGNHCKTRSKLAVASTQL